MSDDTNITGVPSDISVNGQKMSMLEFQKVRGQVADDKGKRLVEVSPGVYKILERLQG
jgi:hypothetical protein